MRWIVSDDVYAETWRNLLEYSNVELALDAIERRHGPSQGAQRSNYLKQASQARVCALQAKEYFDAARSSTVFTSANHAYYGAASIASLMMLILGTGKNSLDSLRKDKKNNHHGLLFSTSCTKAQAPSGTNLLEMSFAEIAANGHFRNWYQTLPAHADVNALMKIHHPNGAFTTRMGLVGTQDVASFDGISGKRFALIDLLKFLPDLSAELGRFGIKTPRSRTNYEVQFQADKDQIHTWRIHGCENTENLELLLDRFRVSSGHSEAITFEGQDQRASGIVTIDWPRASQGTFSWPDSRDTLSHDTISYSEHLQTHEIVDLYLAAYQLSMLSRYFPDIWVSCIESHCRAAKLIERAVELLIKKLPMLALSILSDTPTVVSTHREPWR